VVLKENNNYINYLHKMFIRILVSILSLIILSSQIIFAQSGWMISEKISRQNLWNQSFYVPYNSIDKLVSEKTDSAVYCKDCSVPFLLFQAIRSNEIPVYQLDKKSVLSLIKSSSLEVRYADYLKNIQQPQLFSLEESIHNAELIIFRKPLSLNSTDMKDLSVEWIALEFINTSQVNNKPFRIYLHAIDCFIILNKISCKWTHPVNFSYNLKYSNAIKNRTYIPEEVRVVASTNLQIIPIIQNKSNIPELASKLIKNDLNTILREIPFDNRAAFSTNLYAVCTADIRDQKNLGYYKAKLPELLIQLYRQNKIKGYQYHAEGYYAMINNQLISDYLIFEEDTSNGFTMRAVNEKEIYSIHFMKEYYRTSTTVGTKINWLVLGISQDMSSAFNYNYTIAFRFEDVLSALSAEQRMWFNGSNQMDSMRLDEALRTQRVAYKNMFVYTIYNDTILQVTAHPFYREIKQTDTLSEILYSFTKSLINDFDAANKRLNKPDRQSIITYNLTYHFNTESHTFLTTDTHFTDLILQSIKGNKVNTFQDALLRERINNQNVIYKLDRSRFYRTGNSYKDSVYISALSNEDRYISADKLTEFELKSIYSITDRKEENKSVSLGIIIPPDQNPQYDTEILCYVSYAELLHYLSKSKEGKKYITSFTDLQNKKSIIKVTDFYDMERTKDSNLPDFIIKHVSEK
jgi:hypothetical protein